MLNLNLDVCSAVEGKNAQHDICHIIEKWYEDLIVNYNIDLSDNKKVRNINWLHEQLTKDCEVFIRVRSVVKHYGMTVEDVYLLFSYKKIRNDEVHKNSLNRGATVPILSQQLWDALNLLDKAPNQLQDFSKAFERQYWPVTQMTSNDSNDWSRVIWIISTLNDK
ncbi:hypothetical protein C1646_754040 [Rhizophagus diaphanus]|nr:hypothetical protein C1646_754040 [Rhizophagus diaphanus] [Rhizophagus sp. MUCL 43196]